MTKNTTMDCLLVTERDLPDGSRTGHQQTTQHPLPVHGRLQNLDRPARFRGRKLVWVLCFCFQIKRRLQPTQTHSRTIGRLWNNYHFELKLVPVNDTFSTRFRARRLMNVFKQSFSNVVLMLVVFLHVPV